MSSSTVLSSTSQSPTPTITTDTPCYSSTLWNKESAYSNRPYASLRDIDLVYESFARSCVAAGDACALSYLGSTSAIFSAIDGLVDSLYHHPAPLPDLPASPGLVARARQARLSLFLGGYSVKLWPAHAERIASALKGDYAPLINASLPRLDSSVGKASHVRAHERSRAPRISNIGFSQLPDPSGNQATIAIRCADLKTDEPAPSSSQIAHNVLLALQLNSPRLGDQFSDLSFCHLWPAPRKSAYEGDFALAPGALDTPVLVLSQREDPVTPLASAQHAIEKYGTNARLVEQLGTGHCAVGESDLALTLVRCLKWRLTLDHKNRSGVSVYRQARTSLRFAVSVSQRVLNFCSRPARTGSTVSSPPRTTLSVTSKSDLLRSSLPPPSYQLFRLRMDACCSCGARWVGPSTTKLSYPSTSRIARCCSFVYSLKVHSILDVCVKRDTRLRRWLLRCDDDDAVVDRVKTGNSNHLPRVT